MSKEIQRRRSSIQHNPQMPEELRGGTAPQEMFKHIPELQNIVRLSESNVTRSSWNMQRQGSGVGVGGGMSGIPTPTYSSGRGGARGRGRGGPTPTNSKHMLAVAAGSNRSKFSAGPSSAGPSRSARPGSVGRGRGAVMKPPSGPLKAVSISNLSNSTLNSTRRKSKSYDCLSSMLQTPGFTPGGRRSRSKSPGGSLSTARRGLVNDAGDQGRASIKIVKDKKVHSDMAHYIFNFLESQDCQSKPSQWQDFLNPQKITGTSYLSMVKFLASHFVGNAYFNKKVERGDDDIDRILEVSKLLKYPPAMISKSNLKTPNAQHAWPTCLTFLGWLCCRTQALVNPPPERSGIDELAETGMQEFAFESYVTLFPHHYCNRMDPDAVEAELENFKARVHEANAVELTKNKDELLEERDDRQAELEKLENEVDPCKEAKERHAAALHDQNLLSDRIKEVETQCKHFSNLDQLQIQLERTQIEINTRMAELARLRKQVESQTLSKDEASTVTEETKMLKVQLETLIHLNGQLKKDRDVRTKSVEKFRKDLYEICTMFSVVERYNEIVRFLHMDKMVIAPNPLDPRELEDWMKEASRTLRKAETAVNEMGHKVLLGSDQKSKETMEYQQQIERLEKEMEALKDKLQSVENYNKFLSSELEQKFSEQLNKSSELTTVMHQEEGILNNGLQVKERVLQRHREFTESLEEYKGAVSDAKEKMIDAMEQLMLDTARCRRFVTETTVEAAERQQQFFLQHLGIDIFADDGNEPNGDGNVTG